MSLIMPDKDVFVPGVVLRAAPEAELINLVERFVVVVVIVVVVFVVILVAIAKSVDAVVFNVVEMGYFVSDTVDAVGVVVDCIVVDVVELSADKIVEKQMCLSYDKTNDKNTLGKTHASMHE